MTKYKITFTDMFDNEYVQVVHGAQQLDLITSLIIDNKQETLKKIEKILDN